MPEDRGSVFFHERQKIGVARGQDCLRYRMWLWQFWSTSTASNGVRCKLPLRGLSSIVGSYTSKQLCHSRTCLLICCAVQDIMSTGRKMKYRLYLSRLQKQNEGKKYGGSGQSDFNPNSHQGNPGQQNQPKVHQNNTAGRYVTIDQNLQAQNRNPDNHIDDIKSTATLHVKDLKEAARLDVPNCRKANNVPPFGVVLSFQGTMSNVEYRSVEPSMSKQQPQSGGIPATQFMQYPKHDHEPYSSLEDYSHQSLTSQACQALTNQSQTPSISSIACSPKDNTSSSEMKPVFTNYKSRNKKTIPPVACTVDPVSVQIGRGIVNSHDFGAKLETGGLESWISPSTSMKSEVGLVSLPEDFHSSSFQNIGCFENVGINGMDIFQFNDPTSLTDFRSNWYDGLEFNPEYLHDPMEYPILDDCLFA